jgi:hypothetical protein
VHCLLLHGSGGTTVRSWAEATRLNDSPFSDAELKTGDRLQVASIEFEVIQDEDAVDASSVDEQEAEHDRNEAELDVPDIAVTTEASESALLDLLGQLRGEYKTLAEERQAWSDERARWKSEAARYEGELSDLQTRFQEFENERQSERESLLGQIRELQALVAAETRSQEESTFDDTAAGSGGAGGATGCIEDPSPVQDDSSACAERHEKEGSDRCDIEPRSGRDENAPSAGAHASSQATSEDLPPVDENGDSSLQNPHDEPTDQPVGANETPVPEGQDEDEGSDGGDSMPLWWRDDDEPSEDAQPSSQGPLEAPDPSVQGPLEAPDPSIQEPLEAPDPSIQEPSAGLSSEDEDDDQCLEDRHDEPTVHATDANGTSALEAHDQADSSPSAQHPAPTETPAWLQHCHELQEEGDGSISEYMTRLLGQVGGNTATASVAETQPSPSQPSVHEDAPANEIASEPTVDETSNADTYQSIPQEQEAPAMEHASQEPTTQDVEPTEDPWADYHSVDASREPTTQDVEPTEDPWADYHSLDASREHNSHNVNSTEDPWMDYHTQDDASSKPSPNLPLGYTPRALTPEREQELEAMRELANVSARSAIRTFDKNCTTKEGMDKIPVLLLELTCAVCLTYFAALTEQIVVWVLAAAAFVITGLTTLKVLGLFFQATWAAITMPRLKDRSRGRR